MRVLRRRPNGYSASRFFLRAALICSPLASHALAANPLSVVALDPEHRAPLASKPALRNECLTPDGLTARVERRETRDDTTTTTMWDDTRIAGEVLVSLFDSNGEPAGAGVVVNDLPVQLYAEWSTTLSCLDDGRLVVTWRRISDEGGELVARVLGSDGSPDSEELVLPGSTSAQGGVAASRIGGGTVALAWGIEAGLAVGRFDAATRTFSSPIVLPLPFTTVALESPAEGPIAVVWHAEQGIVATIVDLDSGSFGIPIPLSTHRHGRPREPNATQLDAGRFSVSWRNDAQGGRVARTIAIASSVPTTTSTTTTTTLDAPAIRFGEPVLVDAASPSRWVHYGGRQQLGADSQGTWVATWRAANHVGPRWFDFDYVDTHARSANNGRAWTLGEPIRNEQDLPYSFDARVAGDGSGAWLQIWNAWSRDNGNYEVLAARSGNSGVTWTAPYDVVEPPSRGDATGGGPVFLESNAIAPDNWVMAIGESYHFQEQPSQSSKVRMLTSSDSGKTWTIAAEFPRDAEIAWETGALAASASLSFVVWIENDTLMISRSTDAGASWSTPARLHEDVTVPHGIVSYSGGVDADVDSEGVAIVTWRASGLFGEDDDILYARSTDGGVVWSEPLPVGDYAADDDAKDDAPAIAVDSAGQWVLVWSSHYDGGQRWGMDAEVLVATSTDSGLSWSAPAPLAADAPIDDIADRRPRIDTSTAGRFGVMWSREDTSTRLEQVSILFASTALLCGNGELDEGESCDDGNDVEGDACDSDCAPPSCGNAIVDPGEECDDGGQDDGDNCLASCRLASCGDGRVQRNVEACDDGNDDDSDVCTTTCTVAFCGDGATRAGSEECDDANSDHFDSCLPDCRAARCGDWAVHRGVEQCDDGNDVDDDWCRNDCTLDVNCRVVGGLDAVASDAHHVLRYAVGATAVCAFQGCDFNSDSVSTAVDAAIVLRASVGLLTSVACSGDELVVRLLSPVTLEALQFHIPFSGGFQGVAHRSDGKPDCQSLLPRGALAAWGETDTGLIAGLVSLDGVQGPVDVLSCRIDGGSVGPGEVQVIVDDAMGSGETPIAFPTLVTFGR